MKKIMLFYFIFFLIFKIESFEIDNNFYLNLILIKSEEFKNESKNINKTRYEYDTNYKLIKESWEDTSGITDYVKYDYDKNNLINKLYWFTNNKVSYYQLFFYDEINKIVKIENYNSNNELTRIYTKKYINGRIDEFTIFSNINNIQKITSYKKYKYVVNDNNIEQMIFNDKNELILSKLFIFSQNELDCILLKDKTGNVIEETKYTYDKKLNILKEEIISKQSTLYDYKIYYYEKVSLKGNDKLNNYLTFPLNYLIELFGGNYLFQDK